MIILRQLWNIITDPPYKHINNELGIKMSEYDFILQIRLSDEIKLWKHAWAGTFLPIMTFVVIQNLLKINGHLIIKVA